MLVHPSRGKPREIHRSDQRGDYSGITVRYVKTKRRLYVTGWYDSFVGIEGFDIQLGDFLRELGITGKDIRKEGIE